MIYRRGNVLENADGSHPPENPASTRPVEISEHRDPWSGGGGACYIAQFCRRFDGHLLAVLTVLA